MTQAQIAAMAKKLRNVEPRAVRTALNSELRGVFEEMVLPSDPRIAKLRPDARAYRWRDTHRLIEATQKEEELI